MLFILKIIFLFIAFFSTGVNVNLLLCKIVIPHPKWVLWAIGMTGFVILQWG